MKSSQLRLSLVILVAILATLLVASLATAYPYDATQVQGNDTQYGNSGGSDGVAVGESKPARQSYRYQDTSECSEPSRNVAKAKATVNVYNPTRVVYRTKVVRRPSRSVVRYCAPAKPRVNIVNSYNTTQFVSPPGSAATKPVPLTPEEREQKRLETIGGYILLGLLGALGFVLGMLALNGSFKIKSDELSAKKADNESFDGVADQVTEAIKASKRKVNMSARVGNKMVRVSAEDDNPQPPAQPVVVYQLPQDQTAAQNLMPNGPAAVLSYDALVHLTTVGVQTIPAPAGTAETQTPPTA